MRWNYRIVNTPTCNGGEDLFVIKEVYYDDDTHAACGMCDATLMGDTEEELRRQLQTISNDTLKKPVLHEKDLVTPEGVVAECRRDQLQRGFEFEMHSLPWLDNTKLAALSPEAWTAVMEKLSVDWTALQAALVSAAR